MNIRNIQSCNLYTKSVYNSTYQGNNSHIQTGIYNSSPAVDVVSFKKKKHYIPENKKNIETPFVTDMRELELHCACCGKRMIKNKSVNTFLNRKVYFPAYEALDRIKHEQNFRLYEQSNVMQFAYSYIKRKAKEHPELCMNELVSKKDVLEDWKKFKPQVKQAVSILREKCNNVTHDAKYITKAIEELHPDFQNTESAAFQALKRYARLYPHETIHQILNKPEIKEYYLSQLHSKQNTKLRKITLLIHQFSPEIEKKASRALNDAYRIFNFENTDILHKRGRVLELFENVFSQIPESNKHDKEVAKIIRKKLEALPDSKNDVNSLMLKGAQKNSNAFVELLINRLRNTNEHVKPHHRKDDNGESNYSNYISLCGKCNNKRSAESYDVFIEKNPDMPMNTQRQIDEVCEYINRGIFIDHDTWPMDIKEPLSLESEGKIVISCDKLDRAKAKENREKRHEMFMELYNSISNDDFDSSGTVKRNPRK